MTTIIDDTEDQSGIRPLGELLRAISGLVAVIVLAAAVAGIALLEEHENTAPGRSSAAARPGAAGNHLVDAGQGPQNQRFFVLYVAHTPEQARMAGWIQQYGGSAASAGGHDLAYYGHKILLATDNTAEHLGRTILDTVIDLPDAVLIKVIDMVSVPAK